ncbi:hypothetical protein V5F77_01610 [Xanthobacter sp. DSM 24535]|uniref:hypothetical protein n=1 Tax=Roseixanthobacter psychrophilus TaxID=3119917 RepID=UPI00372C1FDB
MRRWFLALSSCALGALALSGLPAAPALAADGPDLSAHTTATFLSYLDAPLAGVPMTRPPSLGVAFGGRVVRAVMDTGSTGIVVAARAIPDLATLPRLGPGQLTYSSSGRIMRGTWVMTPVQISGTAGAQVTTRPMPVLAVTRVDCLKSARHCRPRRNPTGIAMLGVGFARQGDHQEQSTPDRNPFLAVEGMGDAAAPGGVRRGYIVTRRGVQVGLSADTVAGFSFIKLAKSSEFPDWAAPPACLSLNGRAPEACGTALVDTGVSTMYLSLPPAQQQGQVTGEAAGRTSLPAGAKLSVRLGAEGAGAAYSFAVGDAANPLAPLKVVLVPRGARTFVNTSLRLLNGFDYLYDADGGYVGFRPVVRR